jgi:hypothetical protein
MPLWSRADYGDWFLSTESWRALLMRSTNAVDERGDLGKGGEHIIRFFFVLVWIDKASVRNRGHTHVRGFGGGDAGKRVLND